MKINNALAVQLHESVRRRLLCQAAHLSGNIARIRFARKLYDSALAQTAEPGHLAFGELPGSQFHQIDRFRQAPRTLQMVDYLAIAHGLRGRAARAASGLPSAHAPRPPALPQTSRPRGCRCERPVLPAANSSTNTRHSSAGRARSNCCCNAVIDWPVFSHTSRARITRRCVARHAACWPTSRSTSAKPRVQRLRSLGSGDVLQPTSQLPVGRWAGEDATQQRFQIQAACRPRTAAFGPAGGCRRRPGAPRQRIAPGCTLRPDRSRRSDGGAPRPARLPMAWPCQCPCPDTGPSSPAR